LGGSTLQFILLIEASIYPSRRNK